jgi:hypothetical protein
MRMNQLPDAVDWSNLPASPAWPAKRAARVAIDLT